MKVLVTLLMEPETEEHIRDWEELWQAIYERRNCVLMTGYGLLSNVYTKDGTHTPDSWDSLLNETGAWCYNKDYLPSEAWKKFTSLLKLKKIQEAGAVIEEYIPSNEVIKPLLGERLLSHAGPTIDIHRLLVKIPFRGILTTTPDTYFEDAFISTKTPLYRRIFYMDDILDARQYISNVQNKIPPFIMKLHGDITVDKPLVLSDLDVKQRLSQEQTKEHWRKFLAGSTLFFLGFEEDLPGLSCLRSLLQDRIINPSIEHWIALPQASITTVTQILKKHYHNLRSTFYSQNGDMKEFITNLTMRPSKTKKKESQAAEVPNEPPPISLEDRRKSIPFSQPVVERDEPIETFILWSDSKDDRELCEDFANRLKSLEGMKLIRLWYTGMLSGGDNPKEIAQQHFRNAQIILPLISPDLVSISGLQKHIEEARGKLIIPIVLRDTLDEWKESLDLSGKELPKNGEYISKWSSKSQRDRGYKSLLTDLKAAIQSHKEAIQQELKGNSG